MMKVLQDIANLIEKAADRYAYRMCQRCARGEKARYMVSSDVMRMMVCTSCAAEARQLGLTVVPRRSAAALLQTKLGMLMAATSACIALWAIYTCAFARGKA